jgi:broad specificity phosphatase PhoE
VPAFDLILVRHGVTDWNEERRLMGRLPIRLNARGQAQADATAQALATRPVSAIFASPQVRAQETAARIATAVGIGVQTDPALSEVWLGRWQGRGFAELAGDPDVARFLSDPLHVCDAFEPAVAVHTRVTGFVEQLQAQATTGSVVCVSHGDPLRILTATLLGMELGAYRRLAIDPASITIVRMEGDGGRLLTLNWTDNGPASLRSAAGTR